MSAFKSAVALVALLYALPPAAADLPVHCLRHQIYGEWRFTRGALRESRDSCGHSRPDAEQFQPKRDTVLMEPGLHSTEVTVTLQKPNVAVTSDGQKGTWTMVYDEGFEVNVGGMSYFAFSNFTFKPKVKGHAGPRNVSHCGETMVGWYRTTDRAKYGCYFGVKTAQTAEVFLATEEEHEEYSPEPSHTSRYYEEPLTAEAQDHIVSKLNEKISLLQLGWTAKAQPRWNGRTMREVNTYSGLKRRSSTPQLHHDMKRQRSEAAHSEGGQMFLQRSSAARAVQVLPEAWDWSNASGTSYIEGVMDQGDCGSCYAISSVRMLSARHKINQNNTKVAPWSISFPLACTEYNQGCDGGYGFLLAKWSGEIGLLPDDCLSYSASGICRLECDLKKMKAKRYRVDNHRYVGSFYGGANEREIMEEVFKHGPVAVGMRVDEDFSFYDSGIYASSVKNNKTAPEEWERVDHGILLIGWGVENGKKYWRLQNSWGQDWGEDGYFRIARGSDESAIESMVEAADVVEDAENGKRVHEFFEQMNDPKAFLLQKESKHAVRQHVAA
eukprot:TRINITY_DN10075_c0_g3_i1.p2 TRINITY_DN10075_c0_g3~~TRINITY_DN10075_c0_g3_i1.p2  ORF type:complete len:598 (+),score=159.03 TRINITY_DN10075_c0_g3_i1:134-1795(+)